MIKYDARREAVARAIYYEATSGGGQILWPEVRRRAEWYAIADAAIAASDNPNIEPTMAEVMSNYMPASAAPNVYQYVHENAASS